MAGNVLIKNANGKTVTLQNPDTNLADVVVDTSKIASKQYVDDADALKVALSSFTGANQSLASTGYQKLPGGLIIQWGVSNPTINGTSVSNIDITFPIAFPNSLLQITGSTAIYATDLDVNPSYRQSQSTVIFGGLNDYKTKITASMINLSELTNSRFLRWIAVGY